MMALTDVTVKKTKAGLVTRYKERIELLFNVKLTVSLSRQISLVEDGNTNDRLDDTCFTLQLSSPTSQENVEKAVTFLKAVLGESADYTDEHHSYTQENFEMVLKNCQLVERKSMAVLDFNLSQLDVCIRGDRTCVQAAQNEILTVLLQHDFGSTPVSKSNTETNSSSMPLFQHEKELHSLVSSNAFNRRTLPSIDRPLSPSLVRDIDNNVIYGPPDLNPVHECVSSVRNCSFLNTNSDFDLVERGAAIPISSYSQPIGAVLSAEREEREVIDVDLVQPQYVLPDDDDRSDPRYENKLEFAVKLGYSEQDLIMALSKLGIECDENQLLQELIENSKGLSTVEDVSNEDTSAEEFLGVIERKVKSDDSSSSLRHVVIDGSNVAMSHGKTIFSCRGIKIAVDWFRQRGHKEITVFVPQWRKETSRPDTPITDQEILTDLEKEGIVVFTPARRINGKRVVCYDDRFILKLAVDTNGIVVSNDNYRDLLNENQEFRTVVHERLLMYTFVNDRFMPPEDPLGRRGPTLDNFLRKVPLNPPQPPPECPYGRKCTYGNKCKFHHPERGSQPHKLVTETLKEHAAQKMQERATKGSELAVRRSKSKLTRTKSLAPAESLPCERQNQSALPSALHEAEVTKPTKPSIKKTDYLSEHRLKLQKILADTDVGVFDLTSSRSQELSVSNVSRGSRVSSPAHLNIPYLDAQEGPLVSGHLSLAKKLSDEASDSTFFTGEGFSNRSSPVVQSTPSLVSMSRQDSLPSSLDRLPTFLTLQHSKQQPQLQHQRSVYPQYPSYYNESDSFGQCLSEPWHPQQSNFYLSEPSFMASMTSYDGKCQSFPSTDKEIEQSILRNPASSGDQAYFMFGNEKDSGRREHNTLRNTQSPPSKHFPPIQSSSKANIAMMRQNSTSDPQLHITGMMEPSYSPHHAMNSPHTSMTFDGQNAPAMYSSSGHGRMQAEVRQYLLRSKSMQPQPHSPSPNFTPYERQMSENPFGTCGMDPYWTTHATSSAFSRGMIGSPSITSLPSTPTPSTPGSVGMQSPGVGMWRLDSFQLPPSPLPVQQPRSYPLDHPIQPTDPRFALYSHLCTIFAEPRVRATMNKYPDETDPRKLCNSLMQMQM